MPRLITGLDARRIADNLARVQDAIAQAGRDPRDVQILAAVKYVPLEELGTLAEAGIALVGENRAQELEAKAAAFPDFTWHFIGQLQSRKVKQIAPLVSLIHSVASESALRRLEGTSTPILLEVNVAQDPDKAGIAPEQIGDYIRASPVPVLGLMTMPPFAADPEDSRPYFSRLRELAETHELEQLSMGTSQDYAVAAAEGATIVRIGTTLYT